MPFDPSQPFDVIGGGGKAAPAFDPNQSFDVLPERPGILEEGARAFKSTLTRENPEMLGAGVEAYGRTTGIGALERAGQAIAGVKSDDDYQPSVGSVADIHGVGDAARYAAAGLGSGLASMVPNLVTGAAGAVAGSVVAPGVGTLVGGAIGAAAPAVPMNTGEVFLALKEEGIDADQAANWATAAGLPISALDVLGLGKATAPITKGLKSAVIKDFAKRVAHGLAEGAFAEGSTEGAQELIKQSVAGYLTGNPDLQRRGLAVIDNAIQGALPGAAVGAVSGAAARHAPETPQPVAEEQPAAEPEAKAPLALPAPDAVTALPPPDRNRGDGFTMEAADEDFDPSAPFEVVPALPAPDEVTALPPQDRSRGEGFTVGAEEPVAEPEPTPAPAPAADGGEERYRLASAIPDLESRLTELRGVIQQTTDVPAREALRDEFRATARDLGNTRLRLTDLGGVPAVRETAPAALPAPETTAGDGFTVGQRASDVQRGQQTADLEKKIAARTKAMASIQRGITTATDPAERQKLVTRFRTQQQALGQLQGQLAAMRPEAAPVDVRETGTATAAPVETPVPVTPAAQPVASEEGPATPVAKQPEAAPARQDEEETVPAAPSPEMGEPALAADGEERPEVLFARPPKTEGTEAVRGFVERARADPGVTERLDIGPVENAQQVREATGLDLTGYTRMIDGSGVRHALRAHGDPTAEQSRGQEPITDDDLAWIPEVVTKPDRIQAGPNTRGGLKSVVYEKRVNGQILYVEELREGKRRAVLKTMWKRPGAVAALPSEEGRSLHTSETLPGPEANVEPGAAEDKPQADEPQFRRPAAEPEPAGDDMVRQDRRGFSVGKRLDRASTEARRNVAQAIRAFLERVAPDARAEVVDEILSPEGDSVYGAFERGRSPLSSIIFASMDSPDARGTVSHEVIHFLRRLGYLTDKEWRILSRRAAAAHDNWVKRFKIKDRGYGDNVSVEEAIAEAHSAWDRGELTASGEVARIFAKIREFLERLGNFLRVEGFKSAEDVFRAIERGEVGARSQETHSAPAGALAPAYQRPVATKDKTATPAPAEHETLAARILADTKGGVGKALSNAYAAAMAPGATRKAADEAIRQLVNRLHPIATAEKRINQGRLRDAQKSAFKMAEMAIQDSGRIEQMLTAGPLKWNAEEGITEVVPNVGGLLDIFAPLSDPDTYRRFQTYAIGRRAQRLMEEGRERLLDAKDISAALALETPEFREVFDRYQQFNRAMLQFAVDTGLLPPKSAEEFSKHADYVPFYRVLDEEGDEPLGPRLRKQLSNPDAQIRKLDGGTDKIGDLMENVARNAMSIGKAGLRNVAMTRIHDLVTEAGEVDTIRGDSSKEGAVSYTVNAPSLRGRVKAMRDQGQSYEDIAQRLNIKAETLRKIADGDDMGATTRKVYFRPHDPAITEALASLRPEQLGGLMKIMAGFANLLRQGVTLSPTFMIANLVRGSTAGFIQTGANLSVASNSATGLVKSWKNAAAAREIKTIAGLGGYAFGANPKDIGKQLRQKIGADVAFAPTQILRKIHSTLEKAGEATEMADRIAIYENLRAKGTTKAEAAYQAMNLLNFSRRGASKTVNLLAPLVPFLNARIQGLYRLGETQGEPKALLGVLLRGLVLTGVTAALYALNGDDDRYKAEPLERRLNYHIVYLGKDRKLLIPKAFELGALFSTLPEFAFEAMAKGKWKDAGKATAMTFLNTFSFNPIPAAFQPLLEAVTNYDFFRMQPLETEGQKRLAPGERATASTSQTARMAGRETGISPIQMENLVSGYLGTLGMEALATADTLLGAAGVVPKRPSGVFGSTPVASHVLESTLGRFVKGEPDSANRWVGEFYDLKEQADQTYATVRDLRRQGRHDEASAMQKDKQPLLSVRRQLDVKSEQLSTVNAQIKRARDDKEMSGAAKRAKIDPLIARRNQIVRDTDKLLVRARLD